MNKKWATVLTIVILLAFVGYIIVDATLKKGKVPENKVQIDSSGIADNWIVSQVFAPEKGQLETVAVADNGDIIIGGESFIACYDSGFKLQWEYKTEMPVTALTVNSNIVYGAVQGIILVLNMKGEKIEEWGPFEDNSLITSLSSNESYVTFADAANRLVFILDKKGIVKSTIGNSGEPFIVPSPYFEVALGNDNILYVANPGNRRIEKRNIDGALLGYFGKPGTDPGSFCGCCNPAHFTLIPGGFVTAEKGINRIKILNDKGEFIEFVSSVNNFIRPLPLDLASKDGQTIYAANAADSKLYVFVRR